ncbi:MAG: Lrp/AsnC ligand binding domain-containing protein [Candidatus Thorarchaeota archaeon]
MVTAIVLMQVEAGTVEDVYKAIEKIEFIETVHIVTGPYDIIAYAELPSRLDFRKFVNSIHDVKGVLRTETCVAI